MSEIKTIFTGISIIYNGHLVRVLPGYRNHRFTGQQTYFSVDSRFKKNKNEFMDPTNSIRPIVRYLYSYTTDSLILRLL